MSRGVVVSVAPGVIDVTTVQMNGKSISTAPTTSSAYSSTRPGRTRRVRTGWRAMSVIVHPPTLAVELHEGHEEDDEEQQPREGGCRARLPVAERQVVHLLHDDLGGVVRSAPGHHVHLVEHL